MYINVHRFSNGSIPLCLSSWFYIHSAYSCLILIFLVCVPSSWGSASSWTFPPSLSVWLTRRASMTWRSSPLAPSDRSLLNNRPSRPRFFPFFLYRWPPCSFCSNKKWHTVEIQALCPCGAFSLLSSLLICTWKENSLLAVYFCTCTQWVCVQCTQLVLVHV